MVLCNMEILCSLFYDQQPGPPAIWRPATNKADIRGRGNKHDKQEQATALPQLWIESYWQDIDYVKYSMYCNVSHNQLATTITVSF